MRAQNKDSSLPAVPDHVLKKQEFLFFIENVKDGLWKNNTYLAELCDVDRDTIAEWKKTPQAILARRKANKELRRAFKGRGDIDKRMKEAGFEIEPQEANMNVRVTVEDFTT